MTIVALCLWSLNCVVRNGCGRGLIVSLYRRMNLSPSGLIAIDGQSDMEM
jgi:hypothetical protein